MLVKTSRSEAPVTIRRVTATRFVKVAIKGKSRPLILGCDDEDPSVEVVAKLAASADLHVSALAIEAFVAQIAAAVGIRVAEPLVVEIPDEMRALLPTAYQEPNDGLPAFGSKIIVGHADWGVASRLTEAMVPAALAIVALDAFTEQTDRRFDNPNLLLCGDQLWAIDHEYAFPSMLIGKPKPWLVGACSDLATPPRHALFEQLRGRTLDFTPVRCAWLGLQDDQLAAYSAALPPEWGAANPAINAAILQVATVRDRIDDCIAELGRVLK